MCPSAFRVSGPGGVGAGVKTAPKLSLDRWGWDVYAKFYQDLCRDLDFC